MNISRNPSSSPAVNIGSIRPAGKSRPLERLAAVFSASTAPTPKWKLPKGKRPHGKIGAHPRPRLIFEPTPRNPLQSNPHRNAERAAMKAVGGRRQYRRDRATFRLLKRAEASAQS